MKRQALKINSWGKNIYVKIPVVNSKGEFQGKLIRELIKKECDEIMQINMKNNLKYEIDSLNVSNATSIALYQFYST